MRTSSILSLIFLLISSMITAQTLQWAKSVAGANNENIRDMVHDASGNQYIAGFFSSPTVDMDPGPGTAILTNAGSTTYDIFLAKYDYLGNYIWSKRIGGTYTETVASIKMDTTGNIYIAGEFGSGTLSSSAVDFDPGPGTSIVSALGASDAYIAKYDNSGNFLWAKGIGTSGTEFVSSAAIDSIGNIYFNGIYEGTVDFDAGSGTALM